MATIGKGSALFHITVPPEEILQHDVSAFKKSLQNSDKPLELFEKILQNSDKQLDLLEQILQNSDKSLDLLEQILQNSAHLSDPIEQIHSEEALDLIQKPMQESKILDKKERFEKTREYFEEKDWEEEKLEGPENGTQVV